MAESTVLIAGNRNTSSWTLRAWLALRKSGVSFREHWVDLRAPDAKEQLNQLSPTGLVPVLVHEGDVIWDSLAIAEYASEAFAKGKLWPTDVKRRARARSVAAEMHSGFVELRTRMPMNCLGQNLDAELTPELERDIVRIGAIWQHCLSKSSGPWLFDQLSIADIMYAPVVFRFRSYGVKLGAVEQAYVRQWLSDPELREWLSLCLQEARDPSEARG